MEQLSDEWFAARAGKFTASRSKGLMAKGRSGPSTSRKNLLVMLAVERLTGTVDHGFTNAAMERGTDLEPEARAAYSFATGHPVQEHAFIPHPEWEFCTCSPDGLIGQDGLVEIKCPYAMPKHLAALQSGAHANEHKWQIQHQLLVTGREWVDAVSYDPRFPIGLELAITRVERDAEAIECLSQAIVMGNAEVDGMVREMTLLQRKETV